MATIGKLEITANSEFPVSIQYLLASAINYAQTELEIEGSSLRVKISTTNENSLLLRILVELCHLNIDEQDLTKIQKFQIQYLRWVACSFHRLEIDNRAPLLELPKHRKIVGRQLLTLECQLWSKLWRMICLLPPTSLPRPILFQRIILESALIWLFGAPSEESQTNTIRRWQAENHQLRSHENPFSENDTPATHALIEMALEKKGQVNWFETDYYLDFVDTRMAFVSNLRLQGLYFATDNKIHVEKRGRKKSNLTPRS